MYVMLSALWVMAWVGLVVAVFALIGWIEWRRWTGR
jgi:hypothetical protein